MDSVLHSLYRADLQKTNLQFAYFGSRKKGVDYPKDVTIDLSYADFYRADLSRASLKGAYAKGAVFYQARLYNTVLSDADLSEANFFEADLRGAKFDRALLNLAKFAGARNVPAEIREKLDDHGVYRDAERFRPTQRSEAPLARVFFSRPGAGKSTCDRR